MLSNRAVVHTRFSGPNQRGMIQFVKKFSSQTREVNLKIGIQNSVIKYKNCIIIEHSYPTTSQTNLLEMISGEYEGNFMLS